MYLRDLEMGIIYKPGLHLAEAHRFLFLFPTVFTQVCFYREQGHHTRALLCNLGITGVLSKQSSAHTVILLQYPNAPSKNKSRLSLYSFKHICETMHISDWKQTEI